MKEVVRDGCVVVIERCPGEPNAAASNSAGSPTLRVVGTIRLTTSHVTIYTQKTQCLPTTYGCYIYVPRKRQRTDGKMAATIGNRKRYAFARSSF